MYVFDHKKNNRRLVVGEHLRLQLRQAPYTETIGDNVGTIGSILENVVYIIYGTISISIYGTTYL